MLAIGNLDKLIRTDEIFRIIGIEASKRGVKAWLIGGFVRDGLLGLTPKDADLMFESSGNAESIGNILSSQFGSTLVHFEKHMPVFRITIEGCQYDLADLNELSIKRDQLRRDFTINSIAVELTSVFGCASSGQITLVVASTGIADLENRLLRVNSKAVFGDDPLRIVRLFRFERQLQFAIDPDTLNAVPEYINGLAQISGERVRDELFHILKSNCAADTLVTMYNAGVLSRLFPFLDEMKGVTQNEYHHLDVLEHTLDAIRQFETVLEFSDDLTHPFESRLKAIAAEELVPDRPRAALMKLAILFHDVGKPMTRVVRDDGKVTFIGHDKYGVELIEPYLDYLHLSRREKAYINMLVEGHLRPGFLDPQSPTLPKAIFRFFDRFDDWGVDIVLISIADRLAARGELVDEDVEARHSDSARILLDAYFNRNKVLVKPPDILNGDDLIREFNLEPGKRIGIILKVIKEGQASGDVTDYASGIEYARRFIVESENKAN